MWAFFAQENVSTGACSQLDVIICSDIQRGVKRTVNSELPWITKKKKKEIVHDCRPSVSELILASDKNLSAMSSKCL